MPLFGEEDDDSFLVKSRKPLVKLIDEYTFKAKKTKPGKPVHPAAVVNAIVDCMDDDAIVCGDSGSTTIWFNNATKLTPPQRFVWSANLATLGGGMPQAIGERRRPYAQRLVVALQRGRQRRCQQWFEV